MNTKQNYVGKGLYANPTTPTAQIAPEQLKQADYRQYLLSMDVAESELNRAYVFTLSDNTMLPQLRSHGKVLAVLALPDSYATTSGVVAIATTGQCEAYRLGRITHTANGVMQLEQDNGYPFVVNLSEVDTLLELRKIIGQVIL